MAEQYMKNPTYVLATQYTGEYDSAYAIAEKEFGRFPGGIKFVPNQPFVFYLKNAQSPEVVIEPGNFVIQGSDGEFFTLTEETFYAQYRRG
jgi:hypothetical protein